MRNWRKWLERWNRLQARNWVLKRESGQSLIIIIFALIGLLAFVGLGIDLGLVYIERVRLARAVDAATLAGALELPKEDVAVERAIMFLHDNGYPLASGSVNCTDAGGRLICNQLACDQARIWVNRIEQCSGATVGDVSQIPIDPLLLTVVIDTESSRDQSLPEEQRGNTATRIGMAAYKPVWMNFLQFIGFSTVPVSAYAEAENVSTVDVVVVFDRSGSMEFDTICYGCYEDPNGPPPGYSLQDPTYPDGTHWALPYPCDLGLCEGGSEPSWTTYGGNVWKVIEAEHFSNIVGDYHRETVAGCPDCRYWALGRNDRNYYSGGEAVHASSNDNRGAYMYTGPWNPDFSPGSVSGAEFDAATTPRLDYTFTVPQDGRYYIWARMQGGTWSWNRRVRWGTDGSLAGTVTMSDNRAYYEMVRGRSWQWVRLGNRYWSNGTTHTLNFWFYDPGFSIDKIVITTDSSGSTGNPPSFIRQGHYYANGHHYVGPQETGGLNGWAADRCNPIYSLNIGPGDPDYSRCGCPNDPPARRRCPAQDDLWLTDQLPIRPSKEAVKRFIRRLEPRYDQVGFVSYSSRASRQGQDGYSELQCIRQEGRPCYEAVPPYTTPISFTRVLNAVEETQAGGSTNIADGMRRGLEILSTLPPHFGRPGAAHVMILMTDGVANRIDGLPSDCYAEDNWPYNTGNTTVDRAKDCVIYYADQAATSGVIIYTIGLGAAADVQLLRAVADRTGGAYFTANTPEQLDQIFDDILDRIFLRLVK